MKHLPLLLLIFLLGAGCTAAETTLPIDQPDDHSNSATEGEELTDSTEPPHAVSIAALQQKDFDGRDFTVGQVLAQEEVYTRYAISYMSGELLITGIMNVPKGDGPFPLLVLNHGYIDPAIYTTGRGLRREQDYFAQRGFVVIHSDYRNHAGSDDDPDYRTTLRLGYVEDVINAIAAVKLANLSYIDTERIGMLGHSMGGGIAQAVAVAKPGLVDAFILYAPVSGSAWENYERYTVERPAEAALITGLYGSLDTNPDFWQGASPASYYEAVTEPVMIHIGTEDESTPLVWSQTIADMLEAQNKDVTLHIYEGEAHEFGPQWSTMMQRSVTFFNEQLR